LSHQQHADVTQAELAQQLGADRVVSIREWAALAGVSHRTAKRLLAAGDGPPLLRLSERCRGIRLSDHDAWLDARAIAACSNNNAENETRPAAGRARSNKLEVTDDQYRKTERVQS
jgi:predicted DNA-binding transcriptional regulator AlpA